MLKTLEKHKISLLFEYCEKRFGINKDIFSGYQLYEGSKNKIYLAKELVELRFNPESSGLCIFRLDKTPKPTTNFLQLFGSKISKNYLDVDHINLLEYCKGNDIKVDKELHNLKPGFIAIRFKNIVIGCAHWNEKSMKNQLPKSRRCKINYY
tara:strand:+ start:552 stop:1007 length:456 start_codon:yes stop_codon:yes gene_type:complete